MTWQLYRRIVVPIDFSSRSAEALQLAVQLAGEAKHVDAVHVLPEFAAGEPGMLWNVMDEAARRAHALEALGKLVAEAGVTDVKQSIRFGNAGREICRYAKEAGADLIVIPSHGTSGWERVLLGSVAERVVRLAGCPVLVLKRREQEA